MNIKKLLKNLIQIFKNRKAILQGLYFKFIKFDSYVEDVALARLSICEMCPKIDYVGDKCMVTGSQPCCAECGCSLAFKLRAMSTECPLGKWKAVMSEEQEDKLSQ